MDNTYSDTESGSEPGDSALRGSPGGAASVSDPVESPRLKEPRTLPVWEMERELRRAKAAQLAWMVAFHDEYVAEIRHADQQAYEAAEAGRSTLAPARALARRLEYSGQEASRAVLMYIAQAVNRSEYVVTCEHHAAARAKVLLPQVWEAFLQGRICDLRMRRISSVVEQLRSEEAIAELDAKAPKYAESHRIGQLDSWLKQFVHMAEPEEASERFAQAARQRRVSVIDVEDGMSVLSALIPTLTARAIQRRLGALTRSAVHPVPHNPLIAEHIFELEQEESFARMLPEGAAEPENLHPVVGHDPDDESAAAESPTGEGHGFKDLPTTREGGDPRNLDQRAADAFCAWMLNAETPEGIEIDAQIGIIVREESLTGLSDEPATTRDGTAAISPRHIQDLLAQQMGKLEWYQLLHSKDDDLLAIKSSGRYPPPRLRTALWFRDRTCVVEGCSVPAERCDADHIMPFEQGGPTIADNLQLLCRRHHRLKSWDYRLTVDHSYSSISMAA